MKRIRSSHDGEPHTRNLKEDGLEEGASCSPKKQTKLMKDAGDGRGHQHQKQVLGSRTVSNICEDDSDDDDNDFRRGSADRTDLDEADAELEDPLDEPTDPEKGMKMYMRILDKAYFKKEEEKRLPPLIQDYMKLINVKFTSVRLNGNDISRATIELLGMFVRKYSVLSVSLERMRVYGRIQARVNEKMIARLCFVCTKLKCPSLTFCHLEEAEHILINEFEDNHPILKLVALAKKELKWIKRPGNTSFHNLKPNGKEEPVWDLSEKLYDEMVQNDSNLDYECKIFLIWVRQQHEKM